MDTIFRNKHELIKTLIQSNEVVLDIGFSGQGVQEVDPNWPHAILLQTAMEVYGVDLELSGKYANNQKYIEANAENFNFPHLKFDVIFASDLVEHLSNPGLFLDCCKKHLKPGGRLILTTPNTFNLFNMAEKLTKDEPTVNPDHTFYFNKKVLKKLLEKNTWQMTQIAYVYSLEYSHKESLKKKFLNAVYWFLSKFTSKFIETLVLIAKPV